MTSLLKFRKNSSAARANACKKGAKTIILRSSARHPASADERITGEESMMHGLLIAVSQIVSIAAVVLLLTGAVILLAIKKKK